MGNICRSPSAEGVFRQLVAERAPTFPIEIDSAGTHDYHIGHPPDRRAQAAARRRGLDLSGLKARVVEAADFDRFDLIVAMDAHNRDHLVAHAPSGHRARVRLMMEFAPSAHAYEVPDPYYGGENGFEEVLDLLEEASRGLLETLLEQRLT
jgi:protein-tyrosine phosphatase